MDYNAFRHFADSWGLLYLLVIFVGVILFLMRPGAKKHAEMAAQIPLKDDRSPQGEE
ncbi:cytochrome c oxidase cbb3-type subunit 4 [Maritalea mobilis]|jgi:cytochrome c oxidase cbb3-type subunit 4|uniref:Cytochrome c oxidase cbb3-type subunit 4 n=1 Tax=Maritalea mobilis TaxID=483324 RepID=A0A4R6VQ27_9HYPH|nr:cbb3-type cytochrome c oxidase subunit 3 [Maritalea mobilis]TDQ61727.1 cytochrome c oxidase cbb3-type subunit 4 [Maritalea mobilis]